ncbi:MAG: glycosyltransferase [Candidatus Methanomethylicaceae archaeon]
MTWKERGRNWNIDASEIDFSFKLLKGVQLYIKNVPFYFNPEVILELVKEPPSWLLLGGSWYQPTNLLAMLLGRTLLREKTRLLIWYENPVTTYVTKGVAAGMKRWILRTADAFVVPGERAGMFLRETVGPEIKLLRFANCVDEGVFHSRVQEKRNDVEKLYASWGIDPKRMVFLLPARLASEKGILPFLQAIESVGGEYTILIAGEGPKRGEIASWLANRGHLDIRLLGYQEEERMLELYALSDLLLLPSIYEPYGLVCVEALWAGLPLLVSKEVGSLPEVLKDGENGWSFDPGNSNEVREKFLLALRAGKDKLKEMGQHSIDIARRNFTSSECAQHFAAELLDSFPVKGAERSRNVKGAKGQCLFFFGSFSHPEDVQDNPYASPSTNKFQQHLLRGLSREGFRNIASIGVFPYAAFPRENRLYIGRKSHNLDGNLVVINPSFINIPLIKQISIFLSLFLEVLRQARRYRPDFMLSYNARPFYAGVPALYSKLTGIPHVVMVADFENHRDVSSLKNPLRYIEARLAEKILMGANGLICLSGKIIEDVGYKGPWLKMEGAVDDAWKEYEPVKAVDGETKIVMYSGAFNKWSGIDLLLDAFAHVKGDEFRLWIAGKGDTSRVEEACKHDPRIVFLGYLGEEDYKKAVSRATVLVNPRPSCIKENKYNFPSKLLDYMASGKPVISTLTGDVADEYADKVFVLDEETPEALAALIESVCAMPHDELKAFGENGRGFVLKEKTWEAQIRKLYQFLMRVKDMDQ